YTPPHPSPPPSPLCAPPSFPTRRSSDLSEAFDRKLWQVKPRMPDLPTIESIELRASDLEVPYFGHAAVGHVDGRLEVRRAELDRSEEHTSELQSRGHLVCRLLLEKKKNT